MEKVVFFEDVYTYQIDFAAHVSNIVYIQWMEVGRLKLLQAAGLPVHEIIERYGLLPTLVETSIRYTKPLFLGDTIRIEVWLSQLKNVSAIMEFRFFNQDGELAARGQQRGLFVDQGNKRPRQLNEEQRAYFLPFLESGRSE